MKIVKIKSRNINSLKGDSKINFETFLKDDALFAITGPTGAGKSTILDIITCALYGKTPRLSNPPNALMTQHTGECFCEVEFIIKGKRYRSSWSQRRARNKAEGKLQTAKMEISTLWNDKIIDLKSKEVPYYIEQLSGLDFDRFKQSMMLAQGGFDAFLKASEKHRSQLLEKITGTHIYAEISKEVYEQYSIYKKEIELKEEALGVIEFLDTQTLKEKEDNLEESLKQKKEDDKSLEEFQKVLVWLKMLEELESDKVKYNRKFERVKKEREENRENFLKLELGNKALNIEGIYGQKNRLLTQIERDKNSLKTLFFERNNQKSFELLEKKLKEAENKYEIDRSSYVKIEKISLEDVDKEREFRVNLEEIKGLLQKKKEYKALEESKQNIEERTILLIDKDERLNVQVKEKTTLVDEVTKHLKTLQEKKELEILLAKYEKDREKLIKSQACFLCGSTEHPFVTQGKIVEYSDVEKDIKKEEKSLKQLNKELKVLEKNHTEIRFELESNGIELEKVEKKIDILEKSLNTVLIKDLKEEQSEIEKEVNSIIERRVTKDKLLHKKDNSYNFKREVEEKIHQKSIVLKGLDTKINSLEEGLEEKKLENEALEVEFNSELKKGGFESEELFKESIFKKNERESLAKVCEKIEKSYNNYEILQKDTSDKLEEHKKENLSKLSVDEIETNLNALKIKRDILQKGIGSVEKELEIDAKNRKNKKKKIVELEQKKESFQIWIKLNDMVGQADGTKFSRFAQGITLDQLIFLANNQLEILSNRYELKRGTNKKHLLEIEVIDSFQGDAVRPVSTLSGGESFIVSLSLALGLSSLASRKISIESLFLDEGFGTLDEENLEIALNALSRLQNSGKMVGVISHVKGLKERIPLQIAIVPKGDGTSRVEI